MTDYLDTLDPAKVQRACDQLLQRNPEYVETVGGGNVRFALYMKLVDRNIGRLLAGLGHRDIADWGWFDAFEGEEDPRDAAAEALLEEGFDITPLEGE